MTEKELLDKIGMAASEEQIPESIKPDQIKEKLKKQKGNSSENTTGKNRKIIYGSRVVAAAAVLLICSVAGMQTWKLNQNAIEESSMEMTASDVADSIDVDSKDTAKKNAGDVYKVAKNYEQIYDLLKKREKEIKSVTTNDGGEILEDSAWLDGVVNDIKYAENETITESVSDSTNYSTTNLQMEGVDESDIIKTDGSYIYVVRGDKVIITDIKNGALDVVGEISLSLESASDSIIEMYVDGGKLNLIVQKECTDINKDGGKGDGIEIYSFSSDMETEILTYDISNPKQPKLTGRMSQDGYYHTSRKIGDIIYLFTDQGIDFPDLTKKKAVSQENVKEWIPLVNGNPIDADSIYLSDGMERGLLISSINVKKPDKIVDNTFILSGYVEIYVSTQAVYFYQEQYAKGNSTTQIAKFGLKDGKMNAIAATSVKGEIRDTFAINEYQGKLRVLTTDSNFIEGKSKNYLYLLDENLELTGKISDIAVGEVIYAARYFGNMAYFVTYRNTDPLFAVDLSDEKNPKIVRELKITGFSEYLHFWGKDKLVGIGYETDPESGMREGLKITMFDISDPARLEEIKTMVLKDIDYSQALYDYKAVLVDANENLLGFTTEDYESNSYNYLLFSWENGNFVNLMTEKLAGNFSADDYRGIYVGDIFYVAGRDGICSFDRTKDYRLIDKMEFDLSK